MYPAGTRVGFSRVRVRVPISVPARNPYPCDPRIPCGFPNLVETGQRCFFFFCSFKYIIYIIILTIDSYYTRLLVHLHVSTFYRPHRWIKII